MQRESPFLLLLLLLKILAGIDSLGGASSSTAGLSRPFLLKFVCGTLLVFSLHYLATNRAQRVADSREAQILFLAGYLTLCICVLFSMIPC